MSDGKPTSYSELADVIANLPMLIKEARRARGLSIRGAARELGLAGATVVRIERGEGYVTYNLVAVLRWLDASKADTP